MMQKHMYNDKIKSLKDRKKAVSPDEQIEIDLYIAGMQHAFGDNTDEELHEKRMELYYSERATDKRKGEAYRKGMDAVLYNIVGRPKESGTVALNKLRVSADIDRGLNNIKNHLGLPLTAHVRKAALRWYIEMMSEKYGKDFYNE